MTQISRRHLTSLLAAATATAGLGPAWAQNYPSRPIKLVVPFPPGNMSDLIGRKIADELQARQGTTLVVDNRAGATGVIGVQAVTSAEPDGYTLLVSSNSPLTVNPAVRSDLPFDVMRDLVPVALLGWTGFLIVFSPEFPAKTLAEAVAVMRKEPGKYIAANPGTGTTSHLITEMFSRLTGTKLVHAPYRGSGQALIDVSQGRVHMMIDAMTSSLPQVRGNTVKALAVLSQKRSPLAPEIPSIPEMNIPEIAQFEAMAWTGLLAPARVPPQVIAYWNERSNTLLQDTRFIEALRVMNVEAPPPGSPECLRDLMQAELKRWTELARDANIQAAPQ
jgi:tripartite-type tricarboxylate transporter receptor subunit TctC